MYLVAVAKLTCLDHMLPIMMRNSLVITLISGLLFFRCMFSKLSRAKLFVVWWFCSLDPG